VNGGGGKRRDRIEEMGKRLGSMGNDEIFEDSADIVS
jgi:hypothetical protein